MNVPPTTLLTLWFLVGCGTPADGPEPVPEIGDRVTWTNIRPAEALPVATLPAEVVPAPGAAYAVGPGVSGRLLSWRVAPGDAVVAGQPLADVRSPELSELQARLRTLEVEVASAARTLALQQSGAGHGVVRAVDVQIAQADLERLTAARDALRRTLRVHRDTSTRSGLDWTWGAPGDGVVMDLTCDLEPIGPSTVCVTLLRPGEVVLEVDVPERHLAALDGATATATFYAADGRTWSFTEIGRAPHVDPTTRGRTLRFAPTDAPPLPGTSGRARLEVPPPPGAASLPASALTTLDGTPHVFVRDGADGHPTPVRVLGRRGDEVVVDGLPDGTAVATRGVFLLKSLALLDEEQA